MKNPLINLLTIIFLIILAVSASFYIYNDSKLGSKTQNDNTQSISTVVGSKDGAISINADEPAQNYKIEAVPIATSSQNVSQNSPKTPNLSLPVVNLSHLDGAVFNIAVQNIATLTNELKKDPKNELKWLNLAIFRKMLGDYQTSIEILNYLVILWPNDYVPYNNLADIYQSYLKNFPLSEKNWLKVIELKPDYPEAYENLFTLYTRDNIEKRDQALSILLKGFDQNPHSIDLMLYIARYYRSVGDKEKATVYYIKAIEEAKIEKNEQVETSLHNEMSEMSK